MTQGVTPLRVETRGTGLDLPTWVRAALATVPAQFNGKVEIHCSMGGVSHVNFLWSVKPQKS